MQAERARKSAELELSETSQRVAELGSMLTALTADRRRFDVDMSSARADLEDALREKTEAADRAARLQASILLVEPTASNLVAPTPRKREH